MNRFAVVMLAVASASVALPALADTNVALGKAVSLSGTFGTDPGPWTSASPVPAANLTDGLFETEQHQWNLDSVWWNGYTHPENYATIDLGGVFSINSFKVQADDNDTYKLEYRLGAGAWLTAWNIPAPGPYGLITRASTLASPIVADSLRFTATGGDNYYSVSEIQAWGTSVAAVPEPETYAMMLAGLGLVGLAARRRKSRATG